MNKDLSIIIVNYNVSSFLKLCLYSVLKAAKTINAEVFVVDNASADDFVEMVRTAYPEVNLIENKKNVGFSAANNQAIAKASGDIVLLLNPDTIIPENTFIHLLSFYKEHPDATGVGAKMIDGSGNYLPESKRGLPTPITSFYKFSGLIKLFPESERVAAYYVGHVPSDETVQVPVLAGAFLAFPMEVLKRTEPLDESFFMYGEDIDFSYRLSRIGSNYYYPGITIIHFKGESTKKDRAYLERFYNAMLIFAKKHFFPDYSNFHKWFVTFSIRSIKSLLGTLMFLRGSDKKKNQVFSSQAFLIGVSEGYDFVRKKSGFSEIKLYDSFNDIDLSEISTVLKTNIFIDLQSVSIQDAVAFMERYTDKFTYTFLSPRRDFYLKSCDADSSGEITFL